MQLAPAAKGDGAPAATQVVELTAKSPSVARLSIVTDPALWLVTVTVCTADPSPTGTLPKEASEGEALRPGASPSPLSAAVAVVEPSTLATLSSPTPAPSADGA